jgi:diphthine synthase
MARGRKIYEPPRYMTVNQAIEQLLEVEEKRQQGAYSRQTIAVGMARIGADNQMIVSGTMEELMSVDFGAPLHSLVIPGRMHFMEADLLKQFAINRETFVVNAEVMEH